MNKYRAGGGERWIMPPDPSPVCLSFLSRRNLASSICFVRGSLGPDLPYLRSYLSFDRRTIPGSAKLGRAGRCHGFIGKNLAVNAGISWTMRTELYFWNWLVIIN